MNKFQINTGYIFESLKVNFKNYDRDFIVEKVKEAYDIFLLKKNFYTIKYDGTNGDFLENYATIRFPNALKMAQNVQNFPFPDFILRPQKDSDYFVVVEYCTPLEINKSEYNYDLFFALKLSLTDIMEADEFMQFHLENTFENDFHLCKTFLENICIKYKEFLQEKYLPLVKLFLDKKSIITGPVKESNKDFTTARQVLAITYLLEELNINRNSTSLTEIANFIQFLTGKETGVAKINDTTIYKRVKQPFSKTDKAAENDLQYIRTYFEKLGLQSIVSKLNKEIGSKE